MKLDHLLLTTSKSNKSKFYIYKIGPGSFLGAIALVAPSSWTQKTFLEYFKNTSNDVYVKKCHTASKLYFVNKALKKRILNETI